MSNTKRVGQRSRLIIWSSMVALLGLIVWAGWAELEQITRADGLVIASSRNQVVQVADGGVLAEMRVREGSVVKRGELLARFERTRVEAGYRESRAKAAALRAAVARLQAELLGGRPQFPMELQAFPELRANQQVLFDKRQGALRAELAALAGAMALIQEELAMNVPLLATGDVSRAEILKLKRQEVDIQAQITNRRNKYLQECQTDLVKAQEELESVLQTATQRKEQLDATDIFAPTDGIVRNVRLTTQGGVAKPGEEILQIVPTEDDLIIEAKVKPADIAFVKPGLPTAIKLAAYDYSIYGRLHGTVSYISADTLSEDNKGAEQPYYRVQIKTHVRDLVAKNGVALIVQPGMTAVVEINTGSNTVLRYLTKPIVKTFAESLGER